MELVLSWFVVWSALEACLYLSWFWHGRHIMAPMLMAGLSLTTGALMSGGSLPWITLLLLTMPYRLFNLYRAQRGLSAPQRLKVTCRQTSLYLMGFQIVAALLVLIASRTTLVVDYEVAAFVGVTLALSVYLTTVRSLLKIRWPEVTPALSHRDLPTVTVALPARNETEDLEACLKSLVASDYPKLEIIVLDDCSQNRRTPEIIREFAHAGVRFIAGEAPPESWLAKNFAYEQLLNAANGEYLLFCGVDVRFARATIRMIVEQTLAKELVVASILPMNAMHRGLVPWVAQPLRYSWELSLPRRWSRRPPVISTCWLAKRDFITKNGRFAAVANTILPERYFARLAHLQGAYRFWSSAPEVGLTTEKSGEEQIATAIRMRYPQLQRRPELIMLLTMLYGMLILAPIGGVLSGGKQSVLLLVSNLFCLLLVAAAYEKMVYLTYRRVKGWVFCLTPFAIFYDIFVLHISMWRYEFAEVYWKGRNICLPLMQVLPSLPKLR